MLAEAGEKHEFIKCFDDITGKELPWQAVKQAREQELKICVNLACVKRSMSSQLWQSTTSLPSTQSRSTVTKQISSRICCQRVQKWRQARPVCVDSKL